MIKEILTELENELPGLRYFHYLITFIVITSIALAGLFMLFVTYAIFLS